VKIPTQDEDSQQPMNVLVVAQYSDVPHVTGFAIKWMSKRCLYRFLQSISLTRIAVNPAARRK
jgi:hypothetical protein